MKIIIIRDISNKTYSSIFDIKFTALAPVPPLPGHVDGPCADGGPVKGQGLDSCCGGVEHEVAKALAALLEVAHKPELLDGAAALEQRTHLDGNSPHVVFASVQ